LKGSKKGKGEGKKRRARSHGKGREKEESQRLKKGERRASAKSFQRIEPAQSLQGKA